MNGGTHKPPVALLAGLALATLFAFACDDTFEPFQPGSDLRYSVFGYLNASADTQWIRVTPVRYSVFTSPGNLDAAVTLEELDAGQTTALHDSIFRFGPGSLEEGAESWVHNFWTDDPIGYGMTYQLSVTRGDGATTTVMVPVPEDIPEVVVSRRVSTVGGGGRGRGSQQVVGWYIQLEAEHLALVRVIHYVAAHQPGALAGTFVDCPLSAAAPRVYPIRQPLHLATSVGNVLELPVSPTLHPEILAPEPGTSCVVGRREILIAVSGDAWPTGVQFSASAPAVGEVPSAVEGGLGFVGGVATRTVPFEDCAVRPQTSGAVCEMRYNSQSVTFKGIVNDSRCPWPVEGATVEVSEIGTGPNDPVVVRTTTTDEHGYYEIGALVGGTNYALLVSQPLRWPPDDPFAEQRAYLDLEDTLIFDPGTTVTRDLSLERQVECTFVPD